VQANLVVEGEPPVATFRSQAFREALNNCADDEAAAWAASIRGRQPVEPFTNPVALDRVAASA
jgi:hypothetical protein